MTVAELLSGYWLESNLGLESDSNFHDTPDERYFSTLNNLTLRTQEICRNNRDFIFLVKRSSNNNPEQLDSQVPNNH